MHTTRQDPAAPLVRIQYGALIPGDVIAQFGLRLAVLAVGAAEYPGDVDPLVADDDGEVTRYSSVGAAYWVAVEPRPTGPRFMCGACKMLHVSVGDARACYEDRAAEAAAAYEAHYCESPSCLVEVGCAGYRYDSHANGYWGAGEEIAERNAWALYDEAREAAYGMPPL